MDWINFLWGIATGITLGALIKRMSASSSIQSQTECQLKFNFIDKRIDDVYEMVIDLLKERK